MKSRGSAVIKILEIWRHPSFRQAFFCWCTHHKVTAARHSMEWAVSPWTASVDSHRNIIHFHGPLSMERKILESMQWRAAVTRSYSPSGWTRSLVHRYSNDYLGVRSTLPPVSVHCPYYPFFHDGQCSFCGVRPILVLTVILCVRLLFFFGRFLGCGFLLHLKWGVFYCPLFSKYFFENNQTYFWNIPKWIL